MTVDGTVMKPGLLWRYTQVRLFRRTSSSRRLLDYTASSSFVEIDSDTASLSYISIVY